MSASRGLQRTTVAQSASGDLYAGHDGNVYKRTDSGWSQHTGNGWQQMNTPGGGAGAASGLNRDFAARQNGFSRFNQRFSGGFQSRAGGLGGRRGGFRRR